MCCTVFCSCVWAACVTLAASRMEVHVAKKLSRGCGSVVVKGAWQGVGYVACDSLLCRTFTCLCNGFANTGRVCRIVSEWTDLDYEARNVTRRIEDMLRAHSAGVGDVTRDDVTAAGRKDEL